MVSNTYKGGIVLKAMVLEALNKPLVVKDVREPKNTDDGIIIHVQANGVCRSDWHSWVGHWDWLGIETEFPHVMGHEFSGVVEEVGKNVTRFKKGDRVMVPFTQGDGTCPMCRAGHHNVCDNVYLPGISDWGGYGEYAHIPNADINLVHLPEGIDFVEAAGMGCRYMTAFHGVVDQAQVRPGEFVAVHGCGGLGLSIIQIVTALGAHAIAVDIDDEKLKFAKNLGAVFTVNSKKENAVEAILKFTKRGTQVAVDALGITATSQAAINGLAKRGRHLQIGLTTDEEKGMIPLPIDDIVTKEIQIIGSYGMQAPRYPDMLRMIEQGRLSPKELITDTISIHEAAGVIESMGDYGNVGVTVVDTW